LEHAIAEQKSDLLQAESDRREIESSMQEVQAQLDNDLLKHRSHLNAIIEGSGTSLGDAEEGTEILDVESRSERLAEMHLELARVDKEIVELNQALSHSDAEMSELSQLIRNKEADVETAKAEENSATHAWNQKSSKLDQISTKRATYQRKREECHTKIVALGSLPSGSIDRHQNQNIKQLMDKLERLNKKLSKYSAVNKKAKEQLEEFSKQKESLMDRKKELDEGRTAIMHLIETLDQKKEEAITRTFKLITKHFSDCFKNLVPNGNGSVVMQTAKQAAATAIQARRDTEEEVEQEYDEAELTEDFVGFTSHHYIGVGFRTDFGFGPVSALGSLSGGQQSIVALSLIFAIQRCDPSPFYLFDEIDSALDSIHRRSVARVICVQKETCQFIQTTFAAESLAEADRFYGVIFRNKVSCISAVSKEDAFEFVRAETTKGAGAEEEYED